MGVLEGIRVLEMAGLAPVPYCGMILADFGADVVRVDRLRPGFLPSRPDDPLGRGKRSIRLDLKKPEGAAVVLRLLERADVLVDSFRPGVMEKLGLGPDVALARNGRLVYARLTGWGQSGPYAPMAGHDIDYIAVSGALSLFGRRGERPVPPANLLGDFAAGGLLCALGVLLALLERERSGRGQVIDSAMVDGAAHLATAIHYLRSAGVWSDERGTNFFDTGAPWYDVYETADGKHVAVGAFEPQFFARLLEGLGIDPSSLAHPMDPSGWPAMREAFAKRFREKTREGWCAVFDGTDACVAPVLGLGEMAAHPHVAARGIVVRPPGGMPQPAPAPKLSRTPGEAALRSPREGEHTDSILREAGYAEEQILGLRAAEVTAGEG
jgi:alpha-methylacyl-CoA racemase